MLRRDSSNSASKQLLPKSKRSFFTNSGLCVILSTFLICVAAGVFLYQRHAVPMSLTENSVGDDNNEQVVQTTEEPSEQTTQEADHTTGEPKVETTEEAKCESLKRVNSQLDGGMACEKKEFELKCDVKGKDSRIFVQSVTQDKHEGFIDDTEKAKKSESRSLSLITFCSNLNNMKDNTCQFRRSHFAPNEPAQDAVFTVKYLCSYTEPLPFPAEPQLFVETTKPASPEVETTQEGGSETTQAEQTTEEAKKDENEHEKKDENEGKSETTEAAKEETKQETTEEAKSDEGKSETTEAAKKETTKETTEEETTEAASDTTEEAAQTTKETKKEEGVVESMEAALEKLTHI